MTSKLESILAEYDGRSALLQEFRGVCETLVKDLLKAQGIKVHSVSSRVKDRSSLTTKMSRLGKEYQSLSQVTDVIGLRVITHLEDEVDIVGDLLGEELAIDKVNSVDKRKILDPDRFGYLSLHYVCSISPKRSLLPEYRRFKGMCVEIQVRSILQHAWAEIEHDLGYKAGAQIPAPIRRRFSRLAGLLEIADAEFSRLSDDLRDYAETVKKTMVTSPEDVGLDKISLSRFVETDLLCIELDFAMSSYVGATLEQDSDIGHTVQLLRYAGIKTIEDLHHALVRHKELVRLQWEERLHGQKESSLPKGICLFHLFQVLVVLDGGVDRLTEAFKRHQIGGLYDDDEESNESLVNTILKIDQDLSR